jgi:hypothetical protein
VGGVFDSDIVDAGRGTPFMHALSGHWVLPMWLRRHWQQMPWLAHIVSRQGHIDWLISWFGHWTAS